MTTRDLPALLAARIARTPCPACLGDPTPGQPCRSCRDRGTASHASFARHILKRDPRLIGKWISGKTPLPKAIAKWLQEDTK